MFNDILNDDCVFKIFSYLSPIDLLTTEKVCTLWSKWTAISWTHVKHLDYETISAFQIKKNLNIKDVLDRCAVYVQYFECYNLLDSDIYYNAIAEYCPHLEKLTIFDVSYKCEKADELKFPKKFKQLRAIELHDHPDVEDNALIEIFTNNPELESVYLSGNSMTGYCLQYLPKTLKCLYLKTLYSLEYANLHTCINKCSSLNTLRLDGAMYWENDFSEIVKASPQLMQLSLFDIPTSIEPIKGFKHLTRLFLYDNETLTDGVLKIICESCVNLEAVGLGNRCPINMQRISEQGYKHLSILPKLCELYFWFSDTVNCASLLDVFLQGRLQILRVQNCDFFQDSTALAALRYCINLTCLDLYDCNITLRTVENAMLELRKQTFRRTVLDLRIYNKQFELKEAQAYKHRFLRITESNELKREYFQTPAKFACSKFSL